MLVASVDQLVAGCEKLQQQQPLNWTSKPKTALHPRVGFDFLEKTKKNRQKYDKEEILYINSQTTCVKSNKQDVVYI